MLAAGDPARARADPRRGPTRGRDTAEARALPGHPRRGGRHSRDPRIFRADDAFLDDIDRIIVASQTLDERLLAEVIAVARARQLKLSVVPPVRGMLGTAVQLSHVADLPFIEYYTWDTSRTTLLGKRILDLTVALFGLVLLSPLLIAIAIAIRASSHGPVFFVQRRAGVGGRAFRMFKFRTMVEGADDRLSEIVDIARARRAGVQAPRRPSCDLRRAPVAPHEPRRASAARQRHARRR